jgi:hypothetical protein
MLGGDGGRDTSAGTEWDGRVGAKGGGGGGYDETGGGGGGIVSGLLVSKEVHPAVWNVGALDAGNDRERRGGGGLEWRGGAGG